MEECLVKLNAALEGVSPGLRHRVTGALAGRLEAMIATRAAEAELETALALGEAEAICCGRAHKQGNNP